MKEQQKKRLLELTGICFVLGFCLLPFIWMVIISLSERPDFLLHNEFALTLANFIDIVTIQNLHFLDYLKNSMVIASVSALLSTLIGALAAYAISRISFRGKTLLIVSVL